MKGIRATNGTIVYKLWSVERELLPLTFVQAWSPIIASVSITLLILTVRFWYWGTVQPKHPASSGRSSSHPMAPRAARKAIDGDHHRHDRPDPCLPLRSANRLRLPTGDHGHGPPGICLWDWGERWHRMWLLARWVIVVIALIAVNLVSAVAPPPLNLYETQLVRSLASATAWFQHTVRGRFPPSPPLPPQPIEPPPGTHLELGYSDLFDGIPRVLNLSIDGTLVQRCAMEMDWRKRLPEVLFQDIPIGEATIDFRADGSIVSYTGRPGKLTVSAARAPAAIVFVPGIAMARHRQCVAHVLVPRRHGSSPEPPANPNIGHRRGPGLASTSPEHTPVSGMEQPRLLSSTRGGGPSEEYYSDGSKLHRRS